MKKLIQCHETYCIQFTPENQNSMKNQLPTHILCTETILGPTELLPISSQSKDRQDRLLVQWTNLYKISSRMEMFCCQQCT